MVVGVGALQALQGLCAALQARGKCLLTPLLAVHPAEVEWEAQPDKAPWGGGGWWGRGWLLQ